MSKKISDVEEGHSEMNKNNSLLHFGGATSEFGAWNINPGENKVIWYGQVTLDVD